MPGNIVPYAIIILVALIQLSCASRYSSTLSIPEHGFDVVQHIPKGNIGRDTNTLYMSPRRIRSDEFNTPELYTYIDSMYAVMLRHAGVGIASNQIGKSLQIFIIEAKPDNPRYKVLGPVPKQVFINPRITGASESRKNFWHGCLSAHGEKRGNVATYEWIEYESQNPQGEIQKGRLEGFASVIFQHEFRHLMGGTYLDRARHLLSKEELDLKIDAQELPFFNIASDTLPLLIQGYKTGETIESYHTRKK